MTFLPEGTVPKKKPRGERRVSAFVSRLLFDSTAGRLDSTT
jgi:hypothetical protein